MLLLFRHSVISIVLAALFSAGCGSEPHSTFGDPEEPPPPVDASQLCTEPGSTRCTGLDFETCVEGRWYRTETCGAPTPFCDPEGGCQQCDPGLRFCAARDVYLCDAAGTEVELIETCGSGEECILGQCYDSCTIAESTNSYLGCRFLAVPTANILDPAFASDFAVVVTNPSAVDTAEIGVTRGSAEVASAVIPPGATRSIQLDLIDALQVTDATRLVSGGAYELVSSVPIAAYQYNPLHFRMGKTSSATFSYTNDASLLLPEHVLSGSYLISTWPTFGIGDFPGESEWSPGLMAIAATADNTSVTLTSKANTQGGDVVGIEIGESTTFTLNRGDVAQIFAETPQSSLQLNTCLLRGGEQAGNGNNQSCLDRQLGDLTGSQVEASAPVLVVAGHVCTFMPFNKYACDHLEETMLPLETWGESALMTAPQSPSGKGKAATLYRVLSGGTANFISFVPEVHAPVQLNRGEFIEFLSGSDFLVEGTAPLYVTQALLGEQALGTQSGDPALGSGIPISQWRAEYDFLIPETYSSNWINAVAVEGTAVYLDGVLVEDWEAVPGTGHQVARIELAPGSHHVESVDSVGFGITAYGYASYTSYLLPGGMNFLR